MSLIKHLRGLKTSLVWYFVNTIVSNMPSRHIRYLLLKTVGMKIDKDVCLYAGFHIRNPKGIQIESGVSIGPKVLLDGRRNLYVGKNAVIAYDVIIWTLNHDYNDEGFCVKGGPVRIGAYSWICSRSIILPNITIGDCAVVAAGAVVTKDVPPYAIVGGIPAKVLGWREKKEWNYGYSKSNNFEHIN